MVVRLQWRLGRDLCLEFLKDDRDQIRDWKIRKLIEKDTEGRWKPSDEWTSHVANPVTTKLRE